MAPVLLSRRAAAARLLLGAPLAACAPAVAFRSLPADATTAQTQRIFVVTDRETSGPLIATGARSKVLSHSRIDVAIPPAHEVGRVELPRSGDPPDAARHFAVAGAADLDGPEDLMAEVATAPPGEVVLFVPGYNATLAEVVYRHAQIAADYRLAGPQITFSWASSAQTLGYIYDRNSITVARDALEDLISTLLRQDRPVLVVAHSMGSHLVLEVLRQMAIGGQSTAAATLGVVLLSPDIDIDVFEAQLDRIRPRPDPFVVTVSQRDRALRLSAALSGRPARLGSSQDIARIQALGVDVIDLSPFQGRRADTHLVAATSPAAIAMLNGLRQAGAGLN